jgi:predicted phosphodiesterase
MKEKYDALVFSDPHIYGRNPICRKDNLVELQFEKLNEVKDIANRYKVPVICLGDVTESPHISHAMVSVIAQILNQIDKKFFTLIGQHDLWYYDLSSFDSTALGALVNASQNIHRIEMFNNIYNFNINYAHWNQIPQIREGNIFLTHKPVVPREFVKKYMWLSQNVNNNKFYILEDLPKTYNLIMCGDWHLRYIYRNNKTLLINPGALTRRKANEDSLNTFPSVILISFEFPFNHKILALQIAKNPEEVISSDHLEITKISKIIKEEISKFIELTKIQKNTDKTKFITYLLKIMNHSDMEPEVIEIIRDSLKKLMGDKIKFEETTKKFKLKIKE